MVSMLNIQEHLTKLILTTQNQTVAKTSVATLGLIKTLKREIIQK